MLCSPNFTYVSSMIDCEEMAKANFGDKGVLALGKKRPRVNYFVKEILAGLTKLHNQEHI